MGSAEVETNSELKELQEKIGDLPLLPQILVSILQLNSDSDDFFDQFELLSKEDPGLALKLLALANSSLSSPADAISSIRGALIRMGVSRIMGLVTSLAVQRVFMPTQKSQIRLWQHSIVVAVIAEHFAKLMPELKIDPEEAYLIGLLHDIGRFIMFEHASQDLLRVDEQNWTSPEQLAAADIEIFKFTHSELGYQACKLWQMPKAIADVVRYHHQDISIKIVPGSMEAMIICIQFADRLSMVLVEDKENDNLDTEQTKLIIQEKCCQPLQGHLKMPVDKLIERLNPIRKQCDFSLSGMGFPR